MTVIESRVISVFRGDKGQEAAGAKSLASVLLLLADLRGTGVSWNCDRTVCNFRATRSQTVPRMMRLLVPQRINEEIHFAHNLPVDPLSASLVAFFVNSAERRRHRSLVDGTSADSLANQFSEYADS